MADFGNGAQCLPVDDIVGVGIEPAGAAPRGQLIADDLGEPTLEYPGHDLLAVVLGCRCLPVAIVVEDLVEEALMASEPLSYGERPEL